MYYNIVIVPKFAGETVLEFVPKKLSGHVAVMGRNDADSDELLGWPILVGIIAVFTGTGRFSCFVSLDGLDFMAWQKGLAILICLSHLQPSGR